jgi:hypothetical protein
MATIQCPKCSRPLTVTALPTSGGLKCPLCGVVFPIPTSTAPLETAPPLTPSSATAAGQEAFDPYYTWLGIPPSEQPPHHYRLLGLALFESNQDVIDNAASRQSVHLRSCSTGPRAAFAQYLLNRVSAARVCLLDAGRKAEYDERLRIELSALTAGGKASSTVAKSRTTRAKNPTLEIVKIVLGGIAGLAIGYVLLAIFFPAAIGRQAKPERVAAEQSRPAKVVKGNDSEKAATISSNEPTSTKPAPPATAPAPVATPPTEVSSPPSNSSVTDAAKSQPNSNTQTTPTKVQKGRKKSSSKSKATDDDKLPDTKGVVANPPRSLADLAQPSPPPIVDSPTLIPSHVALPPAEATQWTTLTPLPGAPENFELVQAFDPVIAKLSLTLESGCASSSWLIKYERSNSENGPLQGTLAAFQVDSTSNDLQFRWQDRDAVAAAGLMNSWLRLEVASQSQYIALRKPVVTDAIKLDFEKERTVVPLSVDFIPPTEQLILEVPSVSFLPGKMEFRKGVNYSKLDRETVIESTTMPGAQISIKVAKVPQSPLGLIVEPRFKEPAREFDLTYKQLEKTQQAANEQYQEAKVKIPLLERALKEAREAAESLENRNAANEFQARQKRIELTRLGGIVRDTGKKLVAMQEQSVASQTRLKNVPIVVAFVRSLEGKQIPFRVLVKGSSAELVLVTGTMDVSGN